MNASPSDSLDLPEFDRLAYFSVSVTADPHTSQVVNVYANGRQRCKVEVTFLAQKQNKEVVTLTDAQIRDAVRLIYYNGVPGHSGGEAIGHDDAELAATPGNMWRSSFVAGSYVWTPGSVDTRALGYSMSETPQDDSRDPLSRDTAMPFLDGTQSATFYVSTNTVMTGGIMIGAQISSSSREDPIKSNFDAAPPDDPLGDGSGTLFNSKVTVRSFGVPDYDVACFGDRDAANLGSYYVLEDGSKVYETGDYGGLGVYEHHIHLKIDATTIIPLRSARNESGGTNVSIWTDQGKKNGWEWSFTYLGQPDSGTPEYSYEVIGFFVEDSQTRFTSIDLMKKVGGKIYTKRPGDVVVGQILGKRHYQIVDWGRDPSHHSPRRKFYIRDAYGNDHRIAVVFPGADFNYLAIEKW